MHEDRAALKTLGLTDYGARAYLALVALGEATATQVAAAAPLPRTKVYNVLLDLTRRGWVEMEPGRPRKYRAKRPRECFERERANLETRLAGVLPRLEAQYRDRAMRFAGALWVLEGEEMLAQKTLELLSRARRDVLLVLSFPFAGEDAALVRALRAAMRRGAHVRIALPGAHAPQAEALAALGVEMRVALLPPRLLLVDDQQALVAFPTPTLSGGMDYRGVWNPSAELVNMITRMIELLWSGAEAFNPLTLAKPRKAAAGRKPAR